MSGVGEASLVLGLISSIVQIITAAKDVYQAANDASGLPKSFHDVASKLPIILILLKEAEAFAKSPDVDPETCDAFQKILEPSKAKAQKLHDIFAKVIPKEGASRAERYATAFRNVGKGGRVEALVGDILKALDLLSGYFSFPESTKRVISSALEEVLLMEKRSENEAINVNLKELIYHSTESYPKQGSVADRSEFLRSWLVPQGMLATSSAADQAAHLAKRFRHPETLYTTCDWLFDTEQYREFTGPDPAVLRINGLPGSGKSIICSAIIDRLQSAEDSRVLFFYAHQDPEPSTSMTLARVLLKQILAWDNLEVIAELEKLYFKAPTIDSKDEEDFWGVVRMALTTETQKVFIVVDALHEFAHPHIVVRSLIRITAKLATTTKLSLLISSRLERRDVFDNKSIQSSLGRIKMASCQLEVTQQRIAQDLKELVSYRVNSSPYFEFKSQEIRDKVISGVCDRAKGMFLWANLVLDDLKGDRISSSSAIDTTLARLPKELFDIYQQNLEIPKRSMKGAEVFSWIFCANPPLSWHELQSALAIGDSDYNEDELVDDKCEVFIHHSCGPLVESYGDMEWLRFIHPTVKDFLAERLNIDGPGIGLGIAKAHSMVAKKLLRFLNYADLPRFSSKNDSNPEATLKAYSLKPGRGLYHFATFNWYKYLKDCDKSTDAELESQVLDFLFSQSLIRWLKSAIILSRGDSVSITVDVIDSLQSWILGRHFSDTTLASKIQTWIKDFLCIMLDWGTVLDSQPDWLHHLHHDLLPENNSFRDILEEISDQGVFQFNNDRVITKSSEPASWPERSLAVDLERDLAFTYHEPCISCYHMQTGLLTAEMAISVPSQVRGPLLARKGALCGQGKYLAIIFEAMGPSSDPVGAQIRVGQTLTLDDSNFKIGWSLEKANGADIGGVMAHMIFGIDHAVFVICLLELQHEGPARTHLFKLPAWTTSPVVGIGTQSMRWELDDVNVLNFSSDSSKLATPFGIYDLETGHKTRPWSFALNMVFRGGKVTEDLDMFATTASFDGLSTLQLHSIRDKSANQTFEVPGAAHILAISNLGKFALLLRIQVLEKKNGKGIAVRTQQASVGVWDCHTQGEQWTPILTLDPGFSGKRASWDFATYTFPSRFGPEATKDGETNKILVYAPPGWKLSRKIGSQSTLDPTEGHLVLLESKPNVAPNQKSGKSLALKLQLSTKFLWTNKKRGPDLGLRILSWSPDFRTAFVYRNSGVKVMTRDELKEGVLTDSLAEQSLSRKTTGIACTVLDHRSAFLISPTGFGAFRVEIVTTLTNTEGQNSTADESYNDSANSQNYEITVSCLREDESLPVSSSIHHVSSPNIPYPSLDSLFVCTTGESHLTIGCLELEFSYDYDDEMEIELQEPEESIFQRALKSFASRSQPLGHKVLSDVVKWEETSPNSGYAIFQNCQRDGTSNDQAAHSFLVSGASTTQENIHIFQLSRPYQKEQGERNHQEARSFEVYLCVFNADKDEISWMMHTTTWGDIAQSNGRCPETIWALHPHLPLLVWQLPGHRLRISHLGTHECPLTIAESVTLEAESTNSIKFSPNGRYVAIQGRESFKNDFMNFRVDLFLWSIVLCDLVTGKTIEATLKSTSSLSFDIGDDTLRTYRLKRGGAVECSVYRLPQLDELVDRHYLTFLPANCSCSTCGKPFEPNCNIAIMQYNGENSVVLCHNTINIGKARLTTDTCQPLILRVTTPVQLALDSEDVRNSSFMISGRSEVLPVLDDQKEILEGAFEDSRRQCDKKAENCSCCLHKALKVSSGNLMEPRGVWQLRTMISDFKLAPSNELQAALDKIESTVHDRDMASGVNPPSKDRLQISPENIEIAMQEMESMWNKTLRIGKEAESRARETLLQYKTLLGDEYFPWDTWAEFREAMDERKDEFDFDAYMKGMFEPGKCGIGCNQAFPVNTFSFRASSDANEPKFRWSSAMAIGWIEEDLKWFYDRLLGGDFEGARKWYPFAAYHVLNARAEVLKNDTTEKGARYRRVWEGKVDPGTKSIEPSFEQRLELALPQIEGGKESDSDMKPGSGIGGLLFPMKLKEVFQSMADVVPGFDNFFEKRMHIMLNQSLIGEMEGP